MLQFALCLFLTLVPSVSSNTSAGVMKLKDDDVLTAVENTLMVCSGIAGHMSNFSQNFEAEDARRRNDGMNVVSEVGRKLNTCSKIFDAVKTVREGFCEGVDHDQEDEIDISQPITFNVGGTLFSTNLTNLLSVEGTLFQRMFREGIMTRTSSSDGTYFIDRNPRTFGYIMDYLRTRDLFIGSDAEVRIQLLDDAIYFNLTQEVKDYLRWKPINGIDLWLSEFRYLNQELKLVRQKMGEVLYEAAQDGDSSSTFYSLCKDQGSNVVIIMTSTGNVFGGYSSNSWNSASGSYYTSSTAFLFRLRPSIKRFNILTNGNSVYPHSSYGPVFGRQDILLHSGALTTRQNYVYNQYYDGRNYDINNGVRYFKVQDYAVVKTIPL